MRCPFCGSREDRVLDSRESAEGESIRRRRECKECSRRYTTFEQIEDLAPVVVKRDGKREPFDRGKILVGMQLACKGRPVSAETLAQTAEEIERKVFNRLEREIPASDIGEYVMEALQPLDQVAYVRFASVYRNFEDATQFREIVNMLRRRNKSGA